MKLPWPSLLHLARVAPLAILLVGCGIKKPLSPIADAAVATDATMDAGSGGEPDAPGDAGFDATVEPDAVDDVGPAIDSATDAASDAAVDANGDLPVMPAPCLPPASTICVSPAPSFAAEIVPILDARCNTCHDATIPDAPWPLHEHEDVRDWRTVVVESLLNCTMPPPDSGVALPEPERQRIFAWLACDLPDN